MNILFIVLIIVLIGWWTRNLYFRKLTALYKYKLYSLRDRLRLEFIREEIEKESETFDFLDYSISKSIQYIDCLNIYTIAYLSVKASKDQKFINFNEWVSKKLRDNIILSNYFKEFNQITYEFIKKRFVISFFSIKVIVLYIMGSTILVRTIAYSFRNLAMVMKLLPEEKPVPVLLRSLLL